MRVGGSSLSEVCWGHVLFVKPGVAVRWLVLFLVRVLWEALLKGLSLLLTVLHLDLAPGSSHDFVGVFMAVFKDFLTDLGVLASHGLC